MVNRTVGRYHLVKRILQGNQRRGEPELWQAQDLGDLYYIKVWQRLGDDRNDIRALWNREVRSLMRLQSYPGASEIFARLHDLNSDATQYYVVIDGGRRLLLSQILDTRRLYPWLSNLAESARRRPLWEGLLRIVEAVSILHREGTLHRSLASSAIFAGPEGNGDFRLSGFEWSLRVAGFDGPATKATRRFKLQAPELDRVEPEYSTATDWFDFGLLTAELFGAPLEHTRTRDGVRSQIAQLSQFRHAERQVILDLLCEDPNERLSDSDYVSRRIADIIRDLGGVSIGSTRSLILALRLGPGSRLSDAIENASKHSARNDDPPAQRQWVENDLRGDIKTSARNMPRPHFVLRGENLEYRVNKWSVKGTSTWDVGYCDAVEFRPKYSADDQEFSVGSRKLDIMSLSHVHSHFYKIRDRAAAWDKVFGFPPERYKVPPHLRTVHDFFRITQQLDTLLTVAQICPVKILSVKRSENHTDVELTPLEEPSRNDLALQLGLPNPSEQLRDWFDLGAEAITADDDDPEADDYDLLDRPTITGETIAESWQFVRAKIHPAGARYHFRCDRNYPVRHTKAYLARNHGGTFAQIKRRHKAIEELKSHEALLRLLADPWSVSKKGEEKLPEAQSNISVDGTKIAALKKLWQTQPSFAIQGPPGTGKTTLIQAFADRLFGSDPTAQVLLTAHSHHTVDDVRKKIRKLFLGVSDANAPILVRMGARQPTEDDIRPVTQKMIAKLSQSTLANDSPEFMTTRLHAAAASISETNDLGLLELHTMELLVQDAANVVFATCNSAELEDLADRGRRFDWSVVEEAGKAHGFDMAAALQESHRLLLIGDHFQLPPFNADRLRRLLNEPLKVRKAIQIGAKFAPGLVDASMVEDDDDLDPFEDRCRQWRDMVALFEIIFRKSTRDGEVIDGPAVTLDEQHRMHPDIAELIGRIFYPDEKGGTIIKSPLETREKFDAPPPFLLAPGSWMPQQRIVWYDVPWIQKQEFSEGEIDGLFASRVEAEAVVEILDQFRPRSTEACELQILSPYNDQLKEIKACVEDARKHGRLDPIFTAPFDIKADKRLGATVDEFQGSEADIVIVSLVRNNALVPWKSVGFLKESNRMNVLLSRARHKLVIIGSWDFFMSRCDRYTSIDSEYSYLRRMMELMEEFGKAKRLVRCMRAT